MATIKSFTSLEQSKKLAEILPIESADMNYWCGTQIRIGGHRTMDKDLDVPCWSLASLLSVLPKIVNHETLFIETSAALWHIGYRNVYTARASNLVDACYSMIIKLSELKLL